MSRVAKLLHFLKWELEEKRRKVSLLEGRRAEFEGNIERLEKDLAAEGEVALRSFEGASGYADFANSTRVRQAAIRQSIAVVDDELLAASAENAVAFQEWKRVEILHDRQVAEEKAEFLRREQMEMDELAQRRHRARQN